MGNRRSLSVTAALGLAGALGLSAVATADAAERRFVDVTRLTGAAEVPGPGDPDGRGTAIIKIDSEAGEICYHLIVRQIEPASAAHIHIGDSMTAGPVVQGLEPPTDGSSKNCVTNAALATAIIENPSNYYVNVHNTPFPGGALRGQLG